MGGEGESLLGGGAVSPMKRRPELVVGWAVGSVVSAKLSCLALSISGERERDREGETVCASLLVSRARHALSRMRQLKGQSQHAELPFN